jgi:hypothetical protein
MPKRPGHLGNPGLMGLNNASLGTDAKHTTGADFTTTFRVLGVEGNLGSNAKSDDTLATAHQLGEITAAGIIQRAGTIGADPAYDPSSSNPLLANPAADVDLYHFTVTGSGRYAFTAEVFAGRIGSPLDPALTLFRLDKGNPKPQLVAVNDNTLNTTPANNFPTTIPNLLPLSTDAALFVGLTEGDYYLAVSSSGNSEGPNLQPGAKIFDPTVSHSGNGGTTTGDYVLNLLVQSDNIAPWVMASTPTSGAVLTAPPTQLTVQFSKPVALEQLAYEAYLQTLQQQGQSTPVVTNPLSGLYVLGADGKPYYPQLVSYDQTTNQATFLLLDRLPAGVNAFHLPSSLTDLAGNPLMGNDPSGDYVIRFTIQGKSGGQVGDPRLLSYQAPNSADSPQDLGVLFPHELSAGKGTSAGIRVVHNFRTDPATALDHADYYRFQVLQKRDYFITVTPTGFATGLQPKLFAGQTEVPLLQLAGANIYLASGLDPGTSYVLRVGSWHSPPPSTASYQLQITLGSGFENQCSIP